MKMRRLTLCVLATATLVLGACGGDSDDGGGAAASGLPDPCTVFDSADIAAAFGSEPGAGSASGGGSRRVCQYAPGAGGVGVSDADQYDGSVALARSNGSTCSDVAGVGDRATFCNAYSQVGSLFWVKGDVMYDLTASSVDQAKFTALAARAKA